MTEAEKLNRKSTELNRRSTMIIIAATVITILNAGIILWHILR